MKNLANDNQKMERFIRDKYERKKYCASQPPALRDASILTGGVPSAQVIGSYLLNYCEFQ